MRFDKKYFNVCLVFMPFLVGCVTCRVEPAKVPAFYEEELRSRYWQTFKGQTMAITGWDRFAVSPDEEFVIVKYGGTNSGVTKCLDFFKVRPKEFPRERETYIMLYHDVGPREGNWRDSDVVSVEPIISKRDVQFKIVRKLSLENNGGSNGVLYYIKYGINKDYQMFPTGEEFFIKLSE